MAKAQKKGRKRDEAESTRGELIDRVVKIKRCAAVVKGGRRFSFAAMVVVGDGKGARVGDTEKPTKSPPASRKPSSRPRAA